jgi:hypothetical protein
MPVILDSRVGPHPEPRMGVRLGGESVSSRKFASLASTTSQHTYTINTPSLNTIVDRALYWQSTVVLQFDQQVLHNPNAAASQGPNVYTPGPHGTTAWTQLVRFGDTWSLSSFPLNRLTSSQSLTINDVSMQLQTAQVLPQLLRLADSKEARSAAGGTPNRLGKYALPSRSYQEPGNPYGNTYSGSDDDGTNVPNGAFSNWCYCQPDGTPLPIFGGTEATGAATATPWLPTTGFYGTPVVTGATTGGTSNTPVNCTVTANWISENGAPCVPPPPVTASAANNYVNVTYALALSTAPNILNQGTSAFFVPVYIRLTLCEPIFISPLAYGSAFGSNELGLFGVQTIGFTAQMQTPDVARIIKQTNPELGVVNIQYSSVAAGSANGVFSDSFLQATFITPPIDTPLPDKSVVPYHAIQSFQFPTGQTVPSGGTITGGRATINSGTLTLQNTPEMVLVYVTGKPSDYASAQGVSTPQYQGLWDDWTFPITKASVAYSNQQGLLSGMSDFQLWKMSYANGYEMSFNQWKGLQVGGLRFPRNFGTSVNGVAVAPTVSGSITLPASIANTAALQGLVLPITNGTASITPTVDTSYVYNTPVHVCTTGGALLLRFGKDITLTNGDAPGVAGANAFSIDLEIANYTSSAFTNPVINIVTISTGFFTSNAGKSSLTVTPLTEAAVLKAMEDASEGGISDATTKKETLSGGFLGSLMPNIGNISNLYSRGKAMYDQGKAFYDQNKHYGTMTKNLLASTGNPYAASAASALGKLGMGVGTGEALTGDGKRHKRHHHGEFGLAHRYE